MFGSVDALQIYRWLEMIFNTEQRYTDPIESVFQPETRDKKSRVSIVIVLLDSQLAGVDTLLVVR